AYDKQLLVLAPVKAVDDPNLVDLNWCEFHIHVHGLPLGKMNKEIVAFIGNKLGKFRDVDLDGGGEDWGSYVRIQVAIDITKPLTRALKIRTVLGMSNWLPLHMNAAPMPFRGQNGNVSSKEHLISFKRPIFVSHSTLQSNGPNSPSLRGTLPCSFLRKLSSPASTNHISDLNFPPALTTAPPPPVSPASAPFSTPPDTTITPPPKIQPSPVLLSSESRSPSSLISPTLSPLYRFQRKGSPTGVLLEYMVNLIVVKGQMRNFHRALADCELHDIGFTEDPFTWSNRHTYPHTVSERLDRACANFECSDQKVYASSRPNRDDIGRGRIVFDEWWTQAWLRTGSTISAEEVSKALFQMAPLKSPGPNGRMALKLGVSKAYDKVEWSFMEQVMVKLGFSPSFIRLVMLCISSVSFSFMLSSKQFGSLIPERGVRQGDPLSPYLFLLCTESFSLLLQLAEREGRIQGVSVCRTAPSISHLLFADDTLIFCRASLESTQVVLNVLEVYRQASGQENKFCQVFGGFQ
ncbi:UNVERIFIED_CONTAM: putative mitochondrial protein, partial [Sesamum angustifolium]